MQCHERHSAGCRDVTFGNTPAAQTHAHNERVAKRPKKKKRRRGCCNEQWAHKQEDRKYAGLIDRNFFTSLRVSQQSRNCFMILYSSSWSTVAKFVPALMVLWLQQAALLQPLRVGVQAYCTKKGVLCACVPMSCSMSENAALITCLTYLAPGSQTFFTQHAPALAHTSYTLTSSRSITPCVSFNVVWC